MSINACSALGSNWRVFAWLKPDLKSVRMDPMFVALSYYHRKKFEDAVNVCSQILEKNPYDQVRLSQFYFITNLVSENDVTLLKSCFEWLVFLDYQTKRRCVINIWVIRRIILRSVLKTAD